MKYKDKDWLYQKYWVEKYAMADMGKMVHKSAATIRYWMNKLGIESKTKSQGCKDRYLRKPNPQKKKRLTLKQKKALKKGWTRWRKNNPDFYSGDKSTGWKGGKRITHQGYILIYAPEHPKCGTRKAVPEHRLIAERALGRILKDNEIVHHNNGKKDDNRPKNLLITTKSFHRWLETKMADLYKEEHFQ